MLNKDINQRAVEYCEVLAVRRVPQHQLRKCCTVEKKGELKCEP